MPRVRDDDAFAAKREAILDIAERLMVANGYEGLTVTDLMREARISKGALYHYFASKRDVLAGLLDRRLARWEAALEPIAASGGPADVRLREFLRTLVGAKAQDREFLIDVLRSLYAEENAIAYLAARVGMADRLLPLLVRIVSDGQRDRTFTVSDPGATARVVFSLLQECTDQIGRLLINVADGHGAAGEIQTQTVAYVEALHRTLGANPGRLDFIDAVELRRWARAARASGKAA